MGRMNKMEAENPTVEEYQEARHLKISAAPLIWDTLFKLLKGMSFSCGTYFLRIFLKGKCCSNFAELLREDKGRQDLQNRD